jgi:hypothetical protein
MILPRINSDSPVQRRLSRDENTTELEQTEFTGALCNRGNNSSVRNQAVDVPGSSLHCYADTSALSLAPENRAASTDHVVHDPHLIEAPRVDYSDGIHLDEVEDIVRFSESRLGWNLWFYQYQNVTLLMKDGRGYSGLAKPVESLDALKSQNSSPHRWFSWRTNDAGVRERLNDTTGEWVAMHGNSILDRRTKPRTIDTVVSNTHYAGIWNMGGTVRTTGYRFHASGYFEMFMSLMSQAWEGNDQASVSIRKDASGSNLTANQSVPVGFGDVGIVRVNHRQDMDDSLRAHTVFPPKVIRQSSPSQMQKYYR